MASLSEIVNYTDQLLEIERFKDYCPNGLQVEGKAEVKHIVAGVTASQALLDAAITAKADAILVHHGYFWKNEPDEIIGIKKRRIQTLLEHDISLLAYHLPLDAHAVYGNNVQLAEILDFTIEGRLGDDPEQQLIFKGELTVEKPAKQLCKLIHQRLGREPLHIPGEAQPISTVAWCTGAAQGFIQHAINAGVDAYITGEVSESTVHIARENGIHFFSAGHHATERFGIQALAEHLGQQFEITHQFIDIDNPV